MSVLYTSSAISGVIKGHYRQCCTVVRYFMKLSILSRTGAASQFHILLQGQAASRHARAPAADHRAHPPAAQPEGTNGRGHVRALRSSCPVPGTQRHAQLLCVRPPDLAGRGRWACRHCGCVTV